MNSKRWVLLAFIAGVGEALYVHGNYSSENTSKLPRKRLIL